MHGFSEACERNKDAIHGVLQNFLQDGQSVLEVGSGTGQHAVYFASQFPQVRWQPADTGDYLPGLRARLDAEAADNVVELVELDVRMEPWPVRESDVVFSANTLHFMGEDCVEQFFRGVDQVLGAEGLLLVYGPFNYAGKYTSESNARFDEWLQSTDPVRAIRDFEWVNELAGTHGLQLQQDIAMPANNRMLIWSRTTMT